MFRGARIVRALMACAAAAARTASCARRETLAKSPSRNSVRATIQLPPTAATVGRRRYTGALAALTPPVGMKRTCGNGPASARIVAAPPLASAGKNLSSSQPWSSAAITSDAVDTPGITGIASSRQRSTTRGLNPGVTTNRAPASRARSTCSGRITVPAPTRSSPSAASARSTRTDTSVRNVTSATGRPPRLSADASGRTWSTASATTTGITPPAHKSRRTCGSLIVPAIRRRPR